MSKFSSENLSHAEVKALIRVAAIMVYRFIPPKLNKFYNAKEIADYLGDLPNGQTSAMHADLNNLKKALYLKHIRDNLEHSFPGHFEFKRAETKNDIIPELFNKGYQIKWNVQISQSLSYRTDIEQLQKTISESFDLLQNPPVLKTPCKDVEIPRRHPDDTTSSISENLQPVDNAADQKKRGRPSLTQVEVSTRINRLRMKLKYKNSKNANEQINLNQGNVNQGEETIGEKVLKLITEASCYTERINGERCTSLVTGLLIQDLISNCGCSVEKLPLVVGTVITMLFGDVGDEIYASIVKSHNTYALASERTSLLVVLEIRQRFVERTSEKRILYAHLIIDASNKKGKGCVGKIIVYVGLDGIVRQLALRMDTTVTKKAVGSSRITIESLESEIGDGIVWIMGATTDAFGAAVEEAILVMQHIDRRAENIHLTSPHHLERRSTVMPDQVYSYAGRFRSSCVRTCQMHNFERILAQLISTLMGNQGLAYNMTTAQNLYRVNYYWIKFKSMVDALTVESLGGDPDIFNEAPVEIRNLIGSVNATRWLSTERTSDNLLQTLSIPASEKLIDHVCTFFGGKESADWVTAVQYCTCIDSEELSHTMLTFWYLANHAPGAKKGEGAVGCLSVLGFLGSPYHRITLMLIASLYPIHLSWASFSDKPAEIGVKPNCASTRSIEGVRFDRSFLSSMSALTTNWELFLPDAKVFMDKEALRAKKLGLVQTEKEVTDFFNKMIKEGTSNVMSVALKYFFFPALRPGWCILQVVDPYIGPRAASAILVALRKLGLVEFDSNIADETLLTPLEHEFATVTHDDSGTDEDGSDIDGEDEDGREEENKREDDECVMAKRSKRPKRNKRESNLDSVTNTWTIESQTHAAPTIPMAQYEKIIMDGFIDAPVLVSQGIVNAYGLKHKMIIAELLAISRGFLLSHLDERLVDWKLHRHVSKEFWNIFEEYFPYLADSLTVNFQARSITGTPVEQTFCLTATQIRANQSSDTNAKNMNHASSVKGAIAREMRSFVDSYGANNKRSRKHIFRGTESQCSYLRSLTGYGRKLADIVTVNGRITVPTVVNMRAKGKKVMELTHSLPHTRAEMTANAPGGKVKINSASFLQSIQDSTTSKINSWDTMPEPEKDIFDEAAKKMSLAALRKLLRSYFIDNPEMCSKISKMKRGDNSLSPDTLISTIVAHWKATSDTPPNDLLAARAPSAREREISKMQVPKLREILLDFYNGDDEKCAHIKIARKGDFETPDSLIAMMSDVDKMND